MEPREQRLQAILELVSARGDGPTAREDVYRRLVTKFGVALRTAREDLQDLELRGLVEFRSGYVWATASGRKKRREGF